MLLALQTDCRCELKGEFVKSLCFPPLQGFHQDGCHASQLRQQWSETHGVGSNVQGLTVFEEHLKLLPTVRRNLSGSSPADGAQGRTAADGRQSHQVRVDKRVFQRSFHFGTVYPSSPELAKELRWPCAPKPGYLTHPLIPPCFI